MSEAEIGVSSYRPRSANSHKKLEEARNETSTRTSGGSD